MWVRSKEHHLGKLVVGKVSLAVRINFAHHAKGCLSRDISFDKTAHKPSARRTAGAMPSRSVLVRLDAYESALRRPAYPWALVSAQDAPPVSAPAWAEGQRAEQPWVRPRCEAPFRSLVRLQAAEPLRSEEQQRALALAEEPLRSEEQPEPFWVPLRSEEPPSVP
jgi:hypothetical protein